MNQLTTRQNAPAPDGRGQPRDLRSTYSLLTENGSASLLPISDTFWPEVMRGEHPELEQGRLVSCFDFAQNWASWERHPHGDELVILLRGKVQLLLEQSDRVERVGLTEPGQFMSIPRGTWHTMHPEGPCSMLFITPGRGTEHRPA
jgi:mannose-6-phosphate isomerase-like protein (cupin superfamily)